MKFRIIAALIAVSAITAPIHAAEAGILSNKLGQASFLAKVMKAKVIDKTRFVIRNKILPCFRKVC